MQPAPHACLAAAYLPGADTALFLPHHMVSPALYPPTGPAVVIDSHSTVYWSRLHFERLARTRFFWREIVVAAAVTSTVTFARWHRM